MSIVDNGSVLRFDKRTIANLLDKLNTPKSAVDTIPAAVKVPV